MADIRIHRIETAAVAYGGLDLFGPEDHPGFASLHHFAGAAAPGYRHGMRDPVLPRFLDALNSLLLELGILLAVMAGAIHWGKAFPQRLYAGTAFLLLGALLLCAAAVLRRRERREPGSGLASPQRRRRAAAGLAGASLLLSSIFFFGSIFTPEGSRAGSVFFQLLGSP